HIFKPKKPLIYVQHYVHTKNYINQKISIKKINYFVHNSEPIKTTKNLNEIKL
ncbi:hypothetical protein ABNIH3_15376, partial [Acinetobacter baumannii ABNIH3]